MIAGGIGYGLTKAGIAGLSMLANAALSTEPGITGSLYAEAITAAAREGIKNGTFMLNAIQSIPGIDNAILMYGPEITKSMDIMMGTVPCPPSNQYQNVGFLLNEVIQRFKDNL